MGLIAMPCVILAGGQSRRMGSDKALLPFADGTLLTYQFGRMQGIFEQVYLSCKAHHHFGPYPKIYEPDEPSSPLVGLHAALEALGAPAVFVLCVDNPLVSEDTIRSIVHSSSVHDADVWLARSDARIHPLIGVYARSMRIALKDALSHGRYSLMELMERVRRHEVACGDEAQFANLNTKEAYASTLLRPLALAR